MQMSTEAEMDPRAQRMDRDEALRLLRAGQIEEYNRNAQIERPDLSGADLSGLDLHVVVDGSVVGVWLHTTNLKGADLKKTKLIGANLQGATLDGANLRGAWLAGANLNSASLVAADLTDALLDRAHIHRANLRAATITSADFSRSTLSETEVTGVVYKRSEMRGKYRGIRGVQSAHGDAIFVRDAQDQDYIDTLALRWSGTWREHALLRPWRWIDYGRSILRVAIAASVIAILFGLLYATTPSLLKANGAADTPFTPFYYSIVTYTTLGFGDVVPANLAGQIVVTIEVVFGYLTLGLLLAVLATKVARRS